MKLMETIQQTLSQLHESLISIDEAHYQARLSCLSNASIGQHVRHIIELFQCMNKGYEAGIINYEKRERNELMERDKNFACSLIRHISNGLNKENKELLLQVADLAEEGHPLLVPTNYFRELIYNFEHAIHHMAMIRIALQEMFSVNLPQEYGVAPSTLKYQRHVHG